VTSTDVKFMTSVFLTEGRLEPEQLLGDQSHRKTLSGIVLLSELLIPNILIEEPPPNQASESVSLTNVTPAAPAVIVAGTA
jgi:hypothetical protein